MLMNITGHEPHIETAGQKAKKNHKQMSKEKNVYRLMYYTHSIIFLKKTLQTVQ